MPSSVHGANDGVLKIKIVITYLLVVLTRKNSTLDKDAENRGVFCAAKNFAVNFTMPKAA
jgi:hypothetical protein